MPHPSQNFLIYVIITLIPSIVALFTVRAFVKSLKLHKLIQNTPTSKIGFLKSGFVEVCGKIASTGQKLLAPIKETDCVYYEFKIEEWRKRGKHSSWVTVVKDKQQVPFWIQDETGKALLNLEGAETLFDQDQQLKSYGFFNESTPTTLLDAIASRYNYSRRGWIFQKQVRYKETILEPNDQIYVLGTARVGINEPTIQREKGSVLIVADSSETKALKKLKFKLIGFGCVSTLLIAIALTSLTKLIMSL